MQRAYAGHQRCQHTLVRGTGNQRCIEEQGHKPSNGPSNRPCNPNATGWSSRRKERGPKEYAGSTYQLRACHQALEGGAQRHQGGRAGGVDDGCGARPSKCVADAACARSGGGGRDSRAQRPSAKTLRKDPPITESREGGVLWTAARGMHGWPCSQPPQGCSMQKPLGSDPPSAHPPAR